MPMGDSMKMTMNKIRFFIVHCILFGLAISGGISYAKGAQDVHFVIVIPSYNNKEWFEKNLDSVFAQTYKNYSVIYIDDVSTDGTGDLVGNYIKAHGVQKSITLIKNKKRNGALANIYHAVYTCQDRDVVVLLDGDDWLAHENVLLRLSREYSKKKYWLVYSQFELWPMHEIGWNSVPLPSRYEDPSYPRVYSPSHLRTFYAGLFKKIKKQDLMYEGDFYSMTWDMAIMLPMVEMASYGHVKFIPEVLYTYNNSNPLSDHRVNETLQLKLHAIIAAKTKYKPLKKLKS